MDYIDEFGRRVLEELEDETAVSTPTYAAAAVPNYLFNQILESEDKYVEFAKLAETLKLSLNYAIVGRERFPKISDDRAEIVNGYIAELFKKFKPGLVGNFKGSGKEFLVYAVDVPRSIEIAKLAGYSDDETRLGLFIVLSDDILRTVQNRLLSIESSFDDRAYA